MIKVLSTKQFDQEVINAAKSLNIDVTCIDFIETVSVEWEQSFSDKQNYNRIVFTSSNAVRCFLDSPTFANWLKDKVVYSISGKTNDELLKYNIPITGKAINSLLLAKLIVGDLSKEPVLHICGNRKSEVLKTELEKADIKYESLEVYRTTLLTNVRIPEEFDTILFFSPSGVDAFLASNHIAEKTLCCCVGETTAQNLKVKTSHRRIVSASFPSPITMLQAIPGYFEK